MALALTGEALAAARADRVLTGCSLPPKVAGASRGAVLLSVPHVLPSTAADALADALASTAAASTTTAMSLPRLTLVRVRWWGEDRPSSSLFRPRRISHDTHNDTYAQEGKEEDEDDGDCSLCMRYPVRVPLPQLVDYLRDMRELVLDVVDRATRKKIGRSVVPFQLAPAGSSMSADEVVASLRRANSLCEIQSTRDPKVVLGYLTVNFEIQWTGSPTVSTPLKWTSTSAMLPTVSVNPSVAQQAIGLLEADPGRSSIQQRLSFSSMSSSSAASVRHPEKPWRSGEKPSTVEEGGRLDQLLEKGRALQRSMAVATTEDAAVHVTTDPAVKESVGSTSPLSMKLLMAPYEAMTDEVGTSLEQVLQEAEPIRVQRPAVGSSLRRDTNARLALDAPRVSLGDYNALEISFDSMELQPEMIARLRQLREGSVSTRFSPIQLVVSHEHPRCLVRESKRGEDDRWIAAFAVNSSLRKRQWRTSYAHTLPLLSTGAKEEHPQRVVLHQPALRFRVRCQPQHASPPGRRKRAATQCLLLTAEIPAEEIFDSQDRERVVILPLRVEDGYTGTSTATRPSKKPKMPVGTIAVKFRFTSMHHRQEEDSDREQNDSEQSSINWATSDCGHHPQQERLEKEHSLVAQEVMRSVNRMGKHAYNVGTSLFLGLLVDRAVVSGGSLDPASNTVGSRFTLRVEYGTPAFFGHSSKTVRLRRSAKASLRRVRNDHLKASFGHMNAFPVDVSSEFIQRLDKGLLILEVWIREQSVAWASFVTEKLLGVVKLPLHAFSDCVRDLDAIKDCLRYVTPFVGVDEDFPVVDPLSDCVNGLIHVRMAFGSAEQLFNLKSTVAAVVKLQSRVRGWLTRRAIEYWKQFELESFDGDHDAYSTAHAERLREDSADQARSSTSFGSAPAVPLTRDRTSDLQIEGALVDGGINPQHQVIGRLEIRVEVREEFSKMQGDSAAIGCEIHGHLRVKDSLAAAALLSSSGPRFTLWWDADDARRNSHFAHSLLASDLIRGINVHDVVLLFRVEPQFAKLRRRLTEEAIDVKGAAAIDLESVIFNATTQNHSASRDSDTICVVEDVDVPVEWNGAAHIDILPDILPLRMAVKLSIGTGQRPLHLQADEKEDRDSDHHEPVVVTAIESVSRTERLLPASLSLCLDFQRISDLRDLLQEYLAAANRRPCGEQTTHFLESAIDGGLVTLKIDTALCLGVELHNDEHEHKDAIAFDQDEQKRWYKRFAFEQIELQVINGVQALPSITQGDAVVLVHQEFVSYLQDSSLDVQISATTEDGEDMHVGTVSIPLSALLFRPTGVQGSFPVRVGDDSSSVLAGRLGVHVYIEQNIEPTAPSACEQKTGDVPSPTNRPLRASIAESISTIGMSDEPTVNESSLESAVASIHEASQEIQERLARLTARSRDYNGSAQETELFHETETNVSEQENVISVQSQSPQKRTQDSWVECGDERGDHDCAQYREHDSSQEQFHLRDDDAGSEGSKSESLDNSTDGGVDDFDAFKPITLESFGIGELELSPICDAESPSFRVATDPSRPTDAAMDALSESDTDVGGEADDDVTVEKKSDGEDDAARSVVERDSISEHSELEGRPTGIDVNDSESNVDVADVDRDGDSMVIIELADAETELIDSLTQQMNGGVHGFKHYADSDNDEGADTLGVGDEDNAILTQTELRETDHSGSLEENPSIACDQQEPMVGTDAGTADQDESEATDAHDDAETLEEKQVGYASATEKDDTSTISADVGPVVISTLQPESSDSEHASQLEPVTQEAAIQSEAPSLCDCATQMGEEMLSASTESMVPFNGATQPKALEEIPRIDIACQTEDVVSQTIESKDAMSETLLTAEKSSIVEPELARVQEANKDTELLSAQSPHDSVARADTPMSQGNHDPRELPIGKINTAWQILNEIRDQYVVNAAGLLEMASPAPSDGATRVQTETTTISTIPADVTSVSVADRSEVGDNKRGGGHKQRNGRSLSLAPGFDSSKPAMIHVGTWHWEEESSLRAKVEERLLESKREYEEALALSQSVGSFRSWASSAHFHPSKPLTSEQEEKVLELSASALAKRTRNRLSCVDTETERIARIMQGSVQYWTHGDDDDDDDDVDGETSENDADENYF